MLHQGLGEEQYRSYRTEIIPGFLYLTSCYEAGDARFLRDHGVAHVLNVAEECASTDEIKKLGVQVMHLPLRDSPFTDLGPHWNNVFSFLEQARRRKGRVLVHCREGRNRSATFVLAYLMKSENMTLAAALLKTKSIRKLVDPNIGFRKQLYDMEASLLGGSAPSLPMTASECRALLDLELVVPADLGAYTDLRWIEYEDGIHEVHRPAVACQHGTHSAVAPSAVSRAKAHGRSPRGRAPAAKAGVATSRSPAAGSRRSGGGSRPPLAHSGSPGRRHAAAKRTSSSNSGITHEMIPDEPQAQGPLAEAIALLFFALDVGGLGALRQTDLSEARRLLLSLTRATEAEEGSESPLPALGPDMKWLQCIFSRADRNGDGLLSRSSLGDMLDWLDPVSFDSADVDAALCAGGSAFGIDWPSFCNWASTSSDAAAALLVGCVGLARFQRWALGLLEQPGPHSPGEVATEVESLVKAIKPPFYPTCGTEAERAQLSKVLPRLLLTSWRGAANHELAASLGVTHVLSVGSEFEGERPLEDLGAVYLCIDIDDQEEQAGVMEASLDHAVAFVGTALKTGGIVVVHCAAGISRSATVVLAFLVAAYGMTLRQAFARVLAARPVVWPNAGFMQVLIHWEAKHMRGQVTMWALQYDLWWHHDPDQYRAARTIERPPAEA